MRIADKMNYEQVNTNLAKNRSEMADLHNQAATQKKLLKPSDDPLAAARVLAVRTDINGAQQYLKNINNAKTFLEFSEQSLGELSDTLMRAKELALSQSNDASSNEQSRRVAAAEIEQLFQQSVQIGNRKMGDRYLFGGFRTTRPPFGPDGKYFGDDGQMTITINKDAKVSMNLPGSQIFLGKNLDAIEKQERRQNSPEMVPLEATDPNDTTAESKMRGPASVQTLGVQTDEADQAEVGETWKSGINVFNVMRNLQIALQSDDKEGVQESLNRLDESLAQVVLSRSQLGARTATLSSTAESLQKGQIDSKTMVSNLEDADTFELVSDLNKTESTLKATLATSSKLIQPSLLDFLR